MKSKEKLIWIVGIPATVLLGAGALVCTLYGLTSLAGQAGARWWAVVATTSLARSARQGAITAAKATAPPLYSTATTCCPGCVWSNLTR